MANESIQDAPGPSLRIIIFGKTGTGKSSLINTLFEKHLAKEGDTLYSETDSLDCYAKTIMIVKDVHVTLWDTPGLKNPFSDRETAIKEMLGDKCCIHDIDLFVYCTRFDQTRLERDDVDCIRDITKAFGDGIWKRALFALTFVNQAKVPPSNKTQSLQEYFQSHIEDWRKGLHRAVKENIPDQVDSIPIVPTSYEDDLLPDKRMWLFEFWSACISRVNFFALSAMTCVANDLVKGQAERTEIAKVMKNRIAESANKGRVARCSANHRAPSPSSTAQENEQTIQENITSPCGQDRGASTTPIADSVAGSDSPDGGMAASSSTHGQNGSTVTPPAIESTDGINASQGTTTTTVPLKEFRNSHPDYKAMQIVCNETFEKLVKEYLPTRDRILMEVKEKYMDEAFKGAKYFHSRVEVDLSSITAACDPIKKCLGDPVTFSNNEDVDSSKTFTQTVEYTRGTELIETVTSDWSITGGLSAEYHGIGATTGIGYTEQQSETIKHREGTKFSQEMSETFPVKPKSSRRATVVQKIQRKECTVRNVQLSFPKDAELKCKFHMKGDDPKNVKKRPRFPIREILNRYIPNKSSDPLIAELEGKCVWVETDLFVNVEKDKPLNEL